MKNKKTLFAVLLTLFLVIGVTIAYFQSSASFENIFNTGTYKVVTTEVFESPDNWKPGEEIPKTITTKNEGTIPAAVRVSYTEKWEDKNGTDITTSIPEGAVVINLDNTSGWTKEGNYYYYNYILNPNETTSSFIKSVTLNAQLGSGDDIDCTPSQDGKSVTCEATDPLYGAKYKLTLTKETVQADKYQEVWNTQVNIIERPSIGTDVDYVTSLNGVTLDDWKVFYVDGDYTYIILSDYLPNAYVSDTIKTTYNLDTYYGSYVIASHDDRDDLLNAMTTKSNWDSLLTGTINGHAVSETRTTNVWAMGAPTVDLWVNSWNEKYPSDKLYTRYVDTEDIDNSNFYATGYTIGDSANPTSVYDSLLNKKGYKNKLYFPHQEELEDDTGNYCYGYWLASPSAYRDDRVMYIDYYGAVSYDYTSGTLAAFRPVIRIPTSLFFQ